MKDLIPTLPLVIGSFDLIHKQHVKLFNLTKPNKFNILLVVNSPNKIKSFNTLEQRMDNLQYFNPRIIIVLDLSKINVSAKTFCDGFLKIFNPEAIIVGEDFKFGKDAKGNINSLKKEFNLKVVKYDPKYQTKIIKALYEKGQIEEANKLVYLPVLFTSKVKKGKQLGRKLGYPTMNLHFNTTKHVALSDGVYAGISYINNKKYYSAICVKNNKNNMIIESHVIKNYPENFNAYNKEISIQFLSKINMIKNSKSNLKQIVKNNVEKIKKYFNL